MEKHNLWAKINDLLVKRNVKKMGDILKILDEITSGELPDSRLNAEEAKQLRDHIISEQDKSAPDAPVIDHPQLASMLYPPSLKQLLTNQQIDEDSSEKLCAQCSSLFDVRDLDVREMVDKASVAEKAAVQAKNLAAGMLSNYKILRKERDKLLFQRTVRALQLSEKIMGDYQKAGVDSFASARKYGSERLEKINPQLAAHARLSVISDNEVLNQKLIEAGVTSVIELASTEVADLVDKTGADDDTLHLIHRRAKTASNILHGVLAEDDILGGVHIDWPDHIEDIGWGNIENTDLYLSALGPAAYLVDLIGFVMDFFPQQFPNLDALENRFCRQFKDLAICRETVELEFPQIEIANEVLERFIISRKDTASGAELKEAAQDRIHIYASFTKTGLKFPNPRLLAEMVAAYLNLLGLTGQTITDALAAADGPAGDRAKLDELINQKHIPEAQLRALVQSNPSMGTVDSLPDMVRTSMTGGAYPHSPLTADGRDRYHNDLNQAEKYIQLVKGRLLPKVRANLIHLALKVAPVMENEKKLGNYLHTDLTYSSVVLTTRAANSIEALQSYVQACRLGIEPLQLNPEKYPEFEGRWKWLASYSIWHAAMMVFLYPENFLLQNTRRNRTPEFSAMAGELESEINTLSLIEILENYRRNLPWSQHGTSACKYEDRVLLFGTWTKYDAAENMTRMQIYWSQIDAYGEWSGWRIMPFSPGELDYGPQDRRFEGAFCLKKDVFLVFSTREGVGVREHVEGYGDLVTITKSKYNLQVYRWRPPNFVSPSSSSTDPRPILEWSNEFIYPPTKLINGSLYAVQTGIRPRPVFVTSEETSAIYLNIDQQEGIAHLRVCQRGANCQWTTAIAASSFGEIEGSTYAVPYEISNQVRMLGIGSISGVHYLAFASDTSGAYILAIESGQFKVLNKYSLANDGKKLLGGFAEKQNLALFFKESSNNQRLWVKNLDSSTFGQLSSYAVNINSIYDSVSSFILQQNNLYIVSHSNISYGYGGENSAVTTFLRNKRTLYDTYTFLDNRQLSLYNAPDSNYLQSIKSYMFEEKSGQYIAEQRELSGIVKPDDLIWLFFEETYLHSPLVIADLLNDQGLFEEAYRWLCLIYNPLMARDQRFVYQGIEAAGLNPGVFVAGADAEYGVRHCIAWLKDPFNPFAIARLRKDAWKRHLVIKFIENVLDWADAEYTRDTVESVSRARELYELAEEIFNSELQVNSTVKMSLRIGVKSSSLSVGAAVQSSKSKKGKAGWNSAVVDSINEHLSDFFDAGSWDPETSPAITLVELLMFKIGEGGFLVPPNPVLETIEMRFRSNLDKIRSSCNIAGAVRNLPPYVSPQDPLQILQSSGVRDAYELGAPDEPPPVHRFSYLIERARYYTQTSQQLESLMLQAYKEYDEAQYSVLKAKQDLKIAQANVVLQNLKVQEAEDGCSLASAQTSRAEFQKQHNVDLIKEDLTAAEKDALESLWTSYDWSIAGGIIGVVSGGVSGGISGSSAGWGGAIAGAILGALGAVPAGVSASESQKAQARSMQASYERRKQEWEFQRDLASRDIEIGKKGEYLADDRLNIAGQEFSISRLQQDNANDVINFLETKFTSKELWAWMKRIVKRFYREHLNMATVIARMAQRALAFERQEPIAIVAPYYSVSDRSDLLAAEQLLTDINKLDQHRLTTEKRRKELTKTISLASAAPIEFQRLRRDGWMSFATLMEWFDRDFPGQYLRLIKNVSLTVVGLIPPGEGIHATLINNGISEVVLGPPLYQKSTIHRYPESISVSTASNGTGLFQLNFEDPILLPFEGSGVQTAWILEMPKGANRFNYDTLVDVLLTVNYTAHDDCSGIHRRRVLQQMGADLYGNVPVQSTVSFGLRTMFPDEWYDLHNPVFDGSGSSPYVLEFTLGSEDFPPNEELENMRRLNLALDQTQPVKLPLVIEFQPKNSSLIYMVEADYVWNRQDSTGGPLSLTEFTHRRSVTDTNWTEAKTEFSSNLKPWGCWRVHIQNGGTRLDGSPVDETTYPGIFSGSTESGQQCLNLEGLRDALFVVTYDARVVYCYV